jgi:LEA14-like dessication related protein
MLLTLTAQRSAALFVACMLAACAALAPWIDPPTLTVIGVRLDRVEGGRAVFAVAVELANPNARPVEVTGVDAAVTIEDQRVATAMLLSPVRVPANGKAEAEIIASTGMDAILRATTAAIMRGATSEPGHAPSLRYSIAGDAIFGGGLRVPFSRRGELGYGGVR